MELTQAEYNLLQYLIYKLHHLEYTKPNLIYYSRKKTLIALTPEEKKALESLNKKFSR